MSRSSRGRIVKSSIFIVTEGETEERYFYEFKQHYRCSGIQIKKIKPCSQEIVNNAKRQYEDFKSRKKRFNIRLVIIIDKDELSEDQFNSVCFQAEQDNIELVLSNKSFEVWLLAHFEPVSASVLSISTLKSKLTNHLGCEYKKGNQGQIKKILKNYENAIENTTAISQISYKTQCTNVAEFCEKIRI